MNKLNIIIISLIFTLALSIGAIAQETIDWQNHFGGGGNDYFYKIITVSDGFVAVGRSEVTSFNNNDWAGVSGKGNYDAFIVKYNYNGTLAWKKNFGGTSNDWFMSVAKVSDGYVAVGYSDGGFNTGDLAGVIGIGADDAIIVKYDFDGNLKWKRNFGCSTTDVFRFITVVSDGFVAVGFSYMNNNGDWTGNTTKGGYDATIVKFDFNANVTWKKNFGGSLDERFYSVTTATDGNVVAIGYSETASLGTGDWVGLTGKGNTDCIIVKVDKTTGNIMWKKNLGGTGNDCFHSVVQLTDGNILAVGYAGTTSNGDIPAGKGGQDAIAAIFDYSNGDLLNIYTFGGSGLDHFDCATPILGGFVVVGHSEVGSIGNGDLASFSSGGLDDAVIATYHKNSSGGYSRTKLKTFYGMGIDRFHSVMAAETEDIFAVGYCGAASFPTGFWSNAKVPNYPSGPVSGYGNDDAFFVKYKFVPVTDITSIATKKPVNTNYTLPGTGYSNSYPANYTTIIWSIENDGGTGATLNGYVISSAIPGTVKLKATIENGLAPGVDFIKFFEIEFIKPVTNIANVPTIANINVPLTLSGTVQPVDATYQDIEWSITYAGTTNAVINGNIFTATDAGIATVKATIIGGLETGDYTQYFYITVLSPVSNISNLPTEAIVNQQLLLTGTVEPSDATNSEIAFEITNAGTTNATINTTTQNSVIYNTNFSSAAVLDNWILSDASWDSSNSGSVVMNSATSYVVMPILPENLTNIVLTITTKVGNCINLYTSQDGVNYTVINNLTGGISAQTTTTKNIQNGVRYLKFVSTVTSSPTIIDIKITADNYIYKFNATSGGTAQLNAKIINGTAPGTDYIKSFSINVLTPVTNITNGPTTAMKNVPLTLTGTVIPSNANYQNIEWSIVDAGTTNAVINGNTFTATDAGHATIRATIINGILTGNYTKDFYISVFAPVNDIINLPTDAIINVPLTLNGTVQPSNATHSAILFEIANAGTTNATINTTTQNEVIYYPNFNSAALLDEWEVSGATWNSNYVTLNKFGYVVMPVLPENITNIVLQITTITGNCIDLYTSQDGANYTIAISNLTGGVSVQTTTTHNIANGVRYLKFESPIVSGPRIISVKITANTSTYKLTATAEGTAELTATILNGTAPETNYVKNFNVNIITPVTNIANLPTAAIVNIPLTLSGTVVPSNATYQNIEWSIVSAGSTAATITNNIFTATNTGTATVRATINYGASGLTPYTKDFTISVTIKAVTDIIDVPTQITAGIPLTLTGTVVPSDASFQNIEWSIVNAGSTCATINNGILEVVSDGTLTVRATIKNTINLTNHYTKDFILNVFVPVNDIADLPTDATINIPLLLDYNIVPNYSTHSAITFEITNAGTTNATLSTATNNEIIYNNDINSANDVSNWNLNTTYYSAGELYFGSSTAYAIMPILPENITNMVVNISAYYGNYLVLYTSPDGINYTNISNFGGSGSLTNSSRSIPDGTRYIKFMPSVSYYSYPDLVSVNVTGNKLNHYLTATTGGTAALTATIENGTAEGINYIKNFNVNVYSPVNNITNLPTTATVNIPLQLSGTVNPSTATYQNIVWSIENANATGATINGNTFTATTSGTATVKATIYNGTAIGTDYYQLFPITVNIISIMDIANIPNSTMVNQPLTLTGTVLPSNASYQNIVWSIVNDNGTGATISGGNVQQGTIYNCDFYNSGTLDNWALNNVNWDNNNNGQIILSTSGNGSAIMPIMPENLTNMTISITAIAGNLIQLSTSPDGSSYTNQGSFQNLSQVQTKSLPNGTRYIKFTAYGLLPEFTYLTSVTITADITTTGNIFTAINGGIATVKATVIKGISDSENYTKEFPVTVNIIPVTNIINLPGATTIGIPLSLSATIVPSNATYQNIVWSVVDQGTTGANIIGNTLYTTATGLAIIKATIINGSAMGTNYEKGFQIYVNEAFVPVTSITNLPDFTTTTTPLTLNGTVNPNNATYQTIVWSVINQGTTNATINGSIFTATNVGIATVRATITNAIEDGTANYIQDFEINVALGFVAVSEIINVPTTTILGTDLTLSGTVLPSNATYQDIIWTVSNANGTGAIINNNILTATEGGTATIQAKVINGLEMGTNYTQPFTVTINIIPVTNIVNVAGGATINVPLTLSGTVIPYNASYQNITWSIVNQGETDANIVGNTFIATNAGTVYIKATIANGLSMGTPYEKPFTIIVNDDFVAVNDITNLPNEASSDTPLILSATINPSNATNQTIEWSIVNAGTTGANITGAKFIATSGGIARVNAKITNGIAPDIDFNKEFDISIFVPVTDITNVTETTNINLPLNLTATVEPNNATNKTIIWSIVNAGTTNATLNNNTLITTAEGDVKIRATIVNGTAIGTDYTKDFTITAIETIFVPVTNIIGVPTNATVNTSIFLTATVQPINATNKTIVWTVINQGTTNATIYEVPGIGIFFKASASGNAQIRATIINGTEIEINYIKDFSIIVKSIGIDDITTLQLNVYPNPTNGIITIRTAVGAGFTAAQNGASIQIYDISGRIVQTQLIASQRNTNENELTIDISHLQAGVYFLKIENETVKIIKE